MMVYCTNETNNCTETFILKNRPITVDGYDAKTKKCYKVQGCCWHGCRKCNPEQDGRYNNTMEQNNILENEGYNVVQMWECEWDKLKESLNDKKGFEEKARHQNISIRNVLWW